MKQIDKHMKHRRPSFSVYFLIALIVLLSVVIENNCLVFAADAMPPLRIEWALQQHFFPGRVRYQSFVPHIRIHNDSSVFPVEHITLDFSIVDMQGNLTRMSSYDKQHDVSFYMESPSLDGLDDIHGEGVLPPSTDAEISWWIFPKQAGEHAVEQGFPYTLQVTLSYMFRGQQLHHELPPIYLLVKPKTSITQHVVLVNTVIPFAPQQGDVVIVKTAKYLFRLMAIEDVVLFEPLSVFQVPDTSERLYLRAVDLDEPRASLENRERLMLLYSEYETAFQTIDAAKEVISAFDSAVGEPVKCQSLQQFVEMYDIVYQQKRH